MGWFFPPEPILPYMVCDVDTLNLAFAEIHQQLGGQLNEHNFAADALDDTQTYWEPGIGMFIKHTRQPLDPYDTSTDLPISQSKGWIPVPDFEDSIQTKGGKLWVIASWQISNQASATITRQDGLNFCLEVDGVPYPDAMIGSGDISNDFIQTPVMKFAAGGTLTIDHGTAPAIKGQMYPLALEHVFSVPPGDHTVRLLVRNVSDTESSITVYQVVSNGEFILIEMHT